MYSNLVNISVFHSKAWCILQAKNKRERNAYCGPAMIYFTSRRYCNITHWTNALSCIKTEIAVGGFELRCSTIVFAVVVLGQVANEWYICCDRGNSTSWSSNIHCETPSGRSNSYCSGEIMGLQVKADQSPVYPCILHIDRRHSKWHTNLISI